MVALFVALLVYVVTFGVICAAALLLGGREERVVTWGVIATALASQLALLPGNHWNGPEYGVALVDGVFLIFMVAVACRSTRFWPLWAAASQLMGFISHFPMFFTHLFPKELYLSLQSVWAFPLLFSLLAGTIHHYQRTSRSSSVKVLRRSVPSS